MKVSLSDEALAKIFGGANSAPVITSNGGGSSASISVNENVTAVTTVTATDADVPAQTKTYSISGGADSSKFTINASTGVLTFVAAPNYEVPTDSGLNNVYDVTVKVSDGSLTDTQAIAVTVKSVNEFAPVITSNGGGTSAAINVAENVKTVTTVTATDADLPAPTKTYSISGGADSSKFSINSNTGALTFVTAPNYEAPTDSGANNVYDVTVKVSDGSLTDTQAIAVTVTPVNESTPVITSNGGGTSAAISVAENASAVTTVTATDADQPQTLTYSISGGTDSAKFAINASTGALTFVAAPNYEVPTDGGANNVYDVTVKVSDGSLTDTQTVAVTVTQVNEAPVITSNGGGTSAAISIAENSSAVTTVTATDPEVPAQTKIYSISGGADAASFTINSSTGVLTLIRTPDYEFPLDAGANNVYDVTVKVSDGSLTDTQDIAVTVTPVNENAPVITSNGGGASAAISVAENSSAVTTVTATDADLPTQAKTYSISGTDAAKFSINSSTGVLTFVAAPNYEAPTDAGADNTYNVTVQVSDGSLADTQTIVVNVTSVNDNAPVITSNGGGASAAISVEENSNAVTTVTATDADLPADTLTYSIVGGTDASKFALNGGVLTFVAAPDKEAPADAGADGVYDVTVQVSDGSLTVSQAIAVSVTPVNDNVPVITSNGGGVSAAVNVAENNSAVTTLTATDADLPAETLTYSIVGGADAGKFTLNGGVLTFITSPDKEAPADAGADNVYDVTVQVSDGSRTVTQAIAVNVTSINDNTPVITSNGGGASAAISINENVSVVTTVTASDADLPADTLTYSIVGGADASKFALNGGVLSFIAAADGELPADTGADNVYDVIVQVSDGSQTDAQAIAVSVTPINDNAPIITSNGGGDSAAINVASNSNAVTTVTATDADLPAETITYTIVGGADADKFAIIDGVLTFVAVPNPAAPTDAGANNVYDVIVQASDGSQTDTQAIAATVKQVVTGGVDVVLTDYKLGGAQVEALVVNRTNLPGKYELKVIGTDGSTVQVLVTGDLAPDTAALVYGTPTVTGEQNRNVQARVYVPSVAAIEAKDSSFASQSLDSDGDGLTDDVEISYGLDPNDPADALQDLDGDGLTNIDEINVYSTYHNDPDSDNDSINDGAEIQYGLDPFYDDASLDLDRDFVTNAEEINGSHTDPTVRNPGLAIDTDGDGVNDPLEVGLGLDPANPNDKTVGLDTPEYQQILHVLNRLTFGPTSALIAEVQQMGLSNWINAQLTPIGLGTVGDPALETAQVMRDTHSVGEYAPERLGAIRPVHSLKQLQTKMGVFWDNHFNTDVDKDDATEEELYEEDEFFVNAFGNFETLLNISAKNYTMLRYLDLLYSYKTGPNENYAREVMELHTFGQTTAGGTYTSTDVNELAKILTGFVPVTSAEISRYGVYTNDQIVQKLPIVKFGFDSSRHDNGAKTFLTTAFPAGVNTIAEAESALHMLAVHPVTAKNICTKLANVFISDTPSTSTIDDCVTVFLANTTANDQIGKVLQSLFNSTEFNSTATYKVKFKDTQEFMFSLARFLNWSATNNQAAETTLDGNAFGQTIYNAGQPMFHFEEPTGWLEQGEYWTTSNVVINRFREGNTMVFDSKVNLKNYFTSRNITSTKDIVAHLFLVLLGGKYDASHMEMAYWALHPNNAPFSINDADAETKLKGLVARIVQLSDYSSH